MPSYFKHYWYNAPELISSARRRFFTGFSTFSCFDNLNFGNLGFSHDDMRLMIDVMAILRI
jgi:hypothetical protein